MPLFSVVTSAYNAEEFLKRAIESVVGQTFQDMEYLIVDNGSNDSTRSIIQEYSKKYPSVIKGLYLEKNRGISGGRNYGIEQAAGQYVCFLDADDYWESNKLQQISQEIRNDSDMNMFCHWEYHIHNGIRSVAQYRQPNNEKLYDDLLVNGNCLSTSAMIVSMDLLVENHGFNEDLVSGEEDYDLWLRLANSGGKVLMIDKPLGYWIIRDNSVSAKHMIHTEAVVKVVKTHFDNLIKQSSDKTLKGKCNAAIARLYCGCGRTLSVMGNRTDAKMMFKKSLSCDRWCFKSYAGLMLNALHI